jgi:hypothetical protein
MYVFNRLSGEDAGSVAESYFRYDPYHDLDQFSSSFAGIFSDNPPNTGGLSVCDIPTGEMG